ncbi:MAG: hypothetical protein ACKOX3_07385 [Bacteroidota bacterium]
MKQSIIATIVVGILLPTISFAQADQEWNGIFSELETTNSQVLPQNVVVLLPDSLWHAGLYCYSPGAIKLLTRNYFFLQKKLASQLQFRLQYDGRRFNQFANHELAISVGKKYAANAAYGVLLKYESLKYSNDYQVQSTISVSPEGSAQLSKSVSVYSRISLSVINTTNRIKEYDLTLRYAYNKQIYFNSDFSMSPTNAQCYIGITYAPVVDFSLQIRFDTFNKNAVWQVGLLKNRLSFHLGTKYTKGLGLSPFVGLTSSF